MNEKPKVIIEISFNYLTQNVVTALDMFIKNGENAFLGGAACSVIEFLGRCLRDPNANKSSDAYPNFQEFVSTFMSIEDSRYHKFEKIIYKDLRNGSAHSVMPKGGVSLSLSNDSEDLHLNIVRDVTTDFYYLWIYSPKLVANIKSAIEKFVAKAKKNHKLAENYFFTLNNIALEGQKIINTELSQEEKKKAKPIRLVGDIQL